jgi:hypothetical protein
MNKLITEAEGAKIAGVFKYILEASESILIDHGHVITGQIIKNKNSLLITGIKILKNWSIILVQQLVLLSIIK